MATGCGSVRHPVSGWTVVGGRRRSSLVCWPEQRSLTSPATLLVAAVITLFGAIDGSDQRARRRGVAVLIVLCRRRRRACRIGVGLTATAPPRRLPGMGEGGRRSAAVPVGDACRARARRRAVRALGERAAPSDCASASGRPATACSSRVPAIDSTPLGADAWRGSTWSASSRWSGSPMSLPGGPLDRASNRVRDVLERGSKELPAADAALFRGLVHRRRRRAATRRWSIASGPAGCRT